MTQAIILKLALSACGFLWAYISADKQFGVIVTLACVLWALGWGASAAKDLGEIGSREWRNE